MEIQMWAQMFFEDGTVTRGMRFPAEWLEEQYEFAIIELAKKLLDSANRDEGWLLMWGAGNMVFNHYPSAFSQKMASESDS